MSQLAQLGRLDRGHAGPTAVLDISLGCIVHALWNPTDVDAIVIESISPAGF